MKRIRVLLADDHALVRSGLRALLEAAGNMQVVGEAANGRQAVREAERLFEFLALAGGHAVDQLLHTLFGS